MSARLMWPGAFLAAAVISLAFSIDAEAAKLPKEGKPPYVEDLPPPHNLQIAPVKKSAVISWMWMPTVEAAPYPEMGFDVERRDGPKALTAEMAYTDFSVTQGTYTYRVRARGRVKEKGKWVTHVSPWVGPLVVSIEAVCPQPPRISIKVQTTQQRYSGTPSLRVRMTGQVTQAAECSAARAFFTVDSGTGVNRSGPIALKANGTFDDYADVFEPGDEIPAGAMSFTITATAENDAGIVTSAPSHLTLQLENPYAPKNPF